MQKHWIITYIGKKKNIFFIFKNFVKFKAF